MTKIIFFGTPDYVLPILEELHKYFKLVAVVTQPPKEAGRKKMLTFSPVDNWAHKRKIPVIKDLDISQFPEANLGIVASYGKIIPQNIIEFFPNGILNVHPSLLPHYRGASPIQAQIMDGVTQTGVSVIKMDRLMDHGAVVSVLKDEVLPEDTNETLRNRLFEKSAKFLIDLIPNYLTGKIKLKPQDETQATITKIIDKDDGYVSPAMLTHKKAETAIKIERMVRAYKPWPGIYTHVTIDGVEKRLKILKAHIENEKLVLDRVQLEGKKTVEFEQFKLGYPDMKLL